MSKLSEGSFIHLIKYINPRSENSGGRVYNCNVLLLTLFAYLISTEAVYTHPMQYSICRCTCRVIIIIFVNNILRLRRDCKISEFFLYL